jgi:hypothetical protein
LELLIQAKEVGDALNPTIGTLEQEVVTRSLNPHTICLQRKQGFQPSTQARAIRARDARYPTQAHGWRFLHEKKKPSVPSIKKGTLNKKGHCTCSKKVILMTDFRRVA